MKIETYKNLDVFQRSMALTMRIFDVSKTFPKHEQYSLTDQIRRSSRSVCSNLGEAWRKRRYKAAFISKLSDAESEACETQIWIEIARRCDYLTETDAISLDEECDHVIAQIVTRIDGVENWLIKSPVRPFASSPHLTGPVK